MTSSWFTIFVTCTYASFLALVTYFHEPWRDELQSWSIVLASHSIEDLVRNTSQEGHPLLWFLILYPISKFTSSYLGFQILHGCLAIANAYIIIKYTPFNRLQRAMLVFGYFFLYEYGVIARNYQLGVLLFFILIVVYHKYPPQKSIYYVLLLLLLMAQCNLFALLLSCAAAILVYKNWWQGKISPLQGTLFTIIWLFGLCAALNLITRATSSAETSNLLAQGFDFGKFRSCLMSFSKPIFPIPVLDRYDNWSAVVTSGALHYPLILLICIFILFALHNHTWVWMMLLVYVLLSFLCYYFVFFGYLRHQGYFFVLVIGCLWITAKDQPMSTPFTNHAFTFLLGIHMAIGIYFSVKDICGPFSQAKACAQYIQKQFTNGDILYVGHNDFKTQGIATMCHKKFYLPVTKSYQAYTSWSGDQTLDFPNDSLSFALCIKEAHTMHKSKILFILTQKPDSKTEQKLGRHLQSFEPSMVGDENYYLYLKNLQ